MTVGKELRRGEGWDGGTEGRRDGEAEEEGGREREWTDKTRREAAGRWGRHPRRQVGLGVLVDALPSPQSVIGHPPPVFRSAPVRASGPRQRLKDGLHCRLRDERAAGSH